MSQAFLQPFRVTIRKGLKTYAVTLHAASYQEAQQKAQTAFGSHMASGDGAHGTLWREGAHPDSGNTRNIRLYVQGTHCASCEVLLER